MIREVCFGIIIENNSATYIHNLYLNVADSPTYIMIFNCGSREKERERGGSEFVVG